MKKLSPRGIVVVDVGYTNSKAILFSPDLEVMAERKMPSQHRDGPDYKIIDMAPVFEFLKAALSELDQIQPVDCIIPCAHGACIVNLNAAGNLAFPIMDYASEPPQDILVEYLKQQPDFLEVYCPVLPMALTHAVQEFWLQRSKPETFKSIKTILPLSQYVAFKLSNIAATEISSMACQSQLVNVNTGDASSLAIRQGWDNLYAPRRKAWERLGPLRAEYCGGAFRGRAEVLTGVHDSNGNYLRYLAGGLRDFTLLSTGTWVIGFNSAADITKLDHSKDTNTNTDVLGRPVACSRFFGGKELEVLSQGAIPELATLNEVEKLVAAGTMALPSFSDSGGPFANTGNKGRIIGPPPQTPAARASLAALYCAQMVAAQLSAVASKNQVIVDGPFAKHQVFLSLLAQLRLGQKVHASKLQDGTATGAACLALMIDKQLPHIDLEMHDITASNIASLETYQNKWHLEIEDVSYLPDQCS